MSETTTSAIRPHVPGSARIRTRTEAAFEGGARPTRSSVAWSSVPSLLFILANEAAGLTTAIIAASAGAAILTLLRHRAGRDVGVLLPLSLAYVVGRAVAGLISGSEDVYFGLGIVLNVVVALAVLATVATPRPVGAAAIAVFVNYSPATVAHPRHGRVAAHVTVAWVIAELSLATWEALHLASTSASGFVWLRMLVGWPAMGVLIGSLIFYVRLRLDPIEHELTRSGDQATNAFDQT